MRLGTVMQLWRHPVKSMRGTRVPLARITREYGIPGDRAWALHDVAAGEVRGARRIASLLEFTADYLDEPEGSASPPVRVTLPDGSSYTSDHPQVHEAISEAIGREVILTPRPTGDSGARELLTVPDEATLRAALDLLPDDPLPDYSAYQGASKALDTYFDYSPLSLLTTSAMTELGRLTPGAVVDSRRFRQNLVIETEPEHSGFVELEWVGRRVQIGEVLAEIQLPIPRCRMVSLAQDDLPHDRQILRSLVRETGMTFGVYLDVLEPGTIAEGDPVLLA